MKSFTYSVRAVSAPASRWSRHGSSKAEGGQFIAENWYQWPDIPVYMALEMERDEHPGAVLEVNGLPNGD